MNDYNIAAKTKITNEVDKKYIRSLIRKIVGYATLVRKMGVMAIKWDEGVITPPALEFALHLLCDFTDPEKVEEILTIHIYYSNLTGKILLELCIIRQGVMSIQTGLHPNLMAIELSAFLGEFFNPDDNYIFGDHDRFYQYLEALKEEPFAGDDIELEKMIKNAKSRHLKTIFMKEPSNYLRWGLLNISSESLIKILQSLEINKAVELKAYYCMRKKCSSDYRERILDTQLLLKTYLLKVNTNKE